ncbi:UNVERIFIED_ORG: hypothetical protein GGI62_003343 [Rhizobium esperanzae]
MAVSTSEAAAELTKGEGQPRISNSSKRTF